MRAAALATVIAGLLVLPVTAATADAVVDTISVADGPVAVAVTPDGATAWVAVQTDQALMRVDTATGVIDLVTGTGILPTGVVVSPDGSKVYVSNYGPPGTIDVRTSPGGALFTSIALAAPAEDLAISPDGTRLYVTTGNSAGIVVIDTATDTVVGSIPVSVTGPTSIAITSGGGTAIVTNRFDDTISVVDTATGVVLTTVPVGDAPRGLAIPPSGDFAAVANSGDSTVSIVDGGTLTVVATIPVPAGAMDVAVSADGERLYVSGGLVSDSVTVIDVATGSVIQTLAVAAGPHGLALAPDGTALYSAGFTGDAVSVIALDIAPSVTTASLPDGGMGQAYAATVAATGTAPLTFALDSGSLPPGLTLDAATGAISGTPTTAGSFAFTVRVSNARGAESRAFTLGVTAMLPATGPAALLPVALGAAALLAGGAGLAATAGRSRGPRRAR